MLEGVGVVWIYELTELTTVTHRPAAMSRRCLGWVRFKRGGEGCKELRLVICGLTERDLLEEGNVKVKLRYTRERDGGRLI